METAGIEDDTPLKRIFVLYAKIRINTRKLCFMKNAIALEQIRVMEKALTELKKIHGIKPAETFCDKLKELGIDPKVYAMSFLFTHKDVTQKDLAVKMGVGEATLRRWKSDGFGVEKHIQSIIQNERSNDRF